MFSGFSRNSSEKSSSTWTLSITCWPTPVELRHRLESTDVRLLQPSLQTSSFTFLSLCFQQVVKPNRIGVFVPVGFYRMKTQTVGPAPSIQTLVFLLLPLEQTVVNIQRRRRNNDRVGFLISLRNAASQARLVPFHCAVSPVPALLLMHEHARSIELL